VEQQANFNNSMLQLVCGLKIIKGINAGLYCYLKKKLSTGRIEYNQKLLQTLQDGSRPLVGTL